MFADFASSFLFPLSYVSHFKDTKEVNYKYIYKNFENICPANITDHPQRCFPMSSWCHMVSNSCSCLEFGSGCWDTKFVVTIVERQWLALCNTFIAFDRCISPYQFTTKTFLQHVTIPVHMTNLKTKYNSFKLKINKGPSLQSDGRFYIEPT